MVLLDDDLMLTDESDDEHVSLIFITFSNLPLNISRSGEYLKNKKCGSLLSVGEISVRSSYIHLLLS